MMYLGQEMNINIRQCTKVERGLKTPSDAFRAKLRNKEQKKNILQIHGNLSLELKPKNILKFGMPSSNN